MVVRNHFFDNSNLQTTLYRKAYCPGKGHRFPLSSFHPCIYSHGCDCVERCTIFGGSFKQSAINVFASNIQRALALPPLEVVFPEITPTLPTLNIGSNGTLSISGGKTSAETLMEFRWAKIGAYEAGGFPEDGLFFANHNELVGHFSNGKTAVANNAQITDGIEEASYRGMMRALSESSSGGNVTVVLQGDADGLFKVVQDKANNFTTQTGRPAFLT